MKVIIADDSAIVRAILEQNLKAYQDIDIIASVSNGKRLINAVKTECPDAIISDSDMPELDGVCTLIDLASKISIPICILTEGKTNVEKKHPYSVCLLEKPALNSYSKDFFDFLVEKLRSLVQIEGSPSKAASKNAADDLSAAANFQVLCIGASTGGPTAVSEVLRELGEDFPLPILYTQHIEIGADKTMAEWFCSVCPNIKIKIAEDGEEAKAGRVYMAPADRHLVIDHVKRDGTPVLSLSDEEPERFLRPAVNKLFRSAASHYGRACLAIILTGMGMDGAEGCKKICEEGGWTIAEDKSTCVVFGMPAAAIEMGGAKEILPRPQISTRILNLVRKK